MPGELSRNFKVSTHSRPKAAGRPNGADICHANGFNTQPPEGGWVDWQADDLTAELFQHTAARRRLDPPGTYTPLL